MDGSTQRGKIEVSAGGVGRNIADCLARLGCNPFFISAIGADENGSTVLSKMAHMDTNGINVLRDARTAACAVVLEKKGDCAFVIGDMNAHDHITPDKVRIHEDRLRRAPIVAFDGNIPISTMDYVLSVCSESGVPVWFEPTDVNKAGKFAQCPKWKNSVVYASPNLNELWVMHGQVCRTPTEGRKPQSLYGADERTTNAILKQCFELSVPLLEHLVTVVVTLGPLGALLVTREPEDQPFRTKSTYEASCNRLAGIRAEHYLPLKPPGVASVSGAGDCFAAAMIGAIVRGCDQKSCLHSAMTAAILSMAFKDAVPSSITSDVIDTALANRNEYPRSRVLTFQQPPEEA